MESTNMSDCTDVIIHRYPCTQLKDINNCLLQNGAFDFFVLFIGTLGLIGNGTVFWLLGFCMKRNFFSVYVLNLAVADFGVLTAMWSLFIFAWSYTSSTPSEVYKYLIHLFFFMQCSSVLFLTALSVDRCLVIFFPVWHRCHRPKNLSAIVSSVLWGIACVFWGLVAFCSCCKGTNPAIIAVVVIFGSAMVISTVILFFKVCCNSRLRRHRRIHTAILLSLLFFIVMIVPISLLVYFQSGIDNISHITLLFTCMNSTINPIIYFSIGRCQSLGLSRMSIRDALWRLFRDDESIGSEPESPNLNSSLMSALNKIRPSRSELPTQTGSCPPGSPVEKLNVT
ncbi:mas-related G-protein coupled receptor member X1-like isoform X2 [Paroedura picta]